MQTLFIIEFQANNDGTCTATQARLATRTKPLPCLLFTASALRLWCPVVTRIPVMLVDSEGEVWRGYKQVLRHGHEVVES